MMNLGLPKRGIAIRFPSGSTALRHWESDDLYKYFVLTFNVLHLLASSLAMYLNTDGVDLDAYILIEEINQTVLQAPQNTCDNKIRTN
jgi:hypothetical protein